MSAKMVRYYERIGLIPRAGRSDAGYRLYTDDEVDMLRFIHRARTCGFSIERIRELVGLWQRRQPSREVKLMASEQVVELDHRFGAFEVTRNALQNLADC